jgi:hypothetical protein
MNASYSTAGKNTRRDEGGPVSGKPFFWFTAFRFGISPGTGRSRQRILSVRRATVLTAASFHRLAAAPRRHL